MKPLPLLCVASMVMWVLLCSAATHAAPGAQSGKKKPAASTNAAPVEIPKSAFVVPRKRDEGRDPFFPESIRPYEDSAPSVRPVSRPATLVLNGLSPEFAIINNRTFAKDEEGEVTAGGSRIRIRCIEIKPDSVVVEIVGGERRELRLRPNL